MHISAAVAACPTTTSTTASSSGTNLWQPSLRRTGWAGYHASSNNSSSNSWRWGHARICRALSKRNSEPPPDNSTALQAAAALGKLVKPAWVDLLITGAGAVAETSGKRAAAAPAPPPRPDWRSPVYALILVQLLAFLATHTFAFVPHTLLGLSLRSPQWWQLLSSGVGVVHAQHLAETVFLTYIFGRPLERTSGGWGLWAAYVASVLGANAAALWLLPSKTVAPIMATPAAVFGLFVTGLLLPRLLLKPLEVACLAPFVCMSALTQYAPLTGLLVIDSMKVGHLVHPGGALAGATVVWAILTALSMYKRRVEREQAEREQQEKAKRQQEQANAIAQALGSAAKVAGDVAKKTLF